MYNNSMLPEGTLKNKTILITGGGTGLGKSMGEYFAKLGANLVIISRRQEVLDETASEIEAAAGNKVLPLACDIRKYDQVEMVVKKGVAEFGQIDILINNAAGNILSPTEKLSHRAFDAVVDIVLKGSYNCALALGKYWIEQKIRGNILSITTTYAWTGSGYVVPSACGKAGVLALTRSLAVEWAQYNIRCNAIAPGPFYTEGAWSRLFPKELQYLTDPKENVPAGRLGTHQELSNLAAYLISDFSDYITGEVITIDGGQWLKGAGMFSNMDQVPNDVWVQLQKGKK